MNATTPTLADLAAYARDAADHFERLAAVRFAAIRPDKRRTLSCLDEIVDARESAAAALDAMVGLAPVGTFAQASLVAPDWPLTWGGPADAAKVVRAAAESCTDDDDIAFALRQWAREIDEVIAETDAA